MDLVEYQSGCRGRHPWELSRFNLFLSLLTKNHIFEKGPIHVLDVGSGDAWFAAQLLKYLPQGSTIDCWDSGYEDSKTLDEIRKFHPVNISYHHTQPTKKYDLLLLMDVLEHVKDDRDFLQSIAQKNMSEDATLLISVPAWQKLYSCHDELLFHFRRYSPSEIKAVIQSASLKIQRRGTIFTSLLIFRALEVLKVKLFSNTSTAKLENWNAGRHLTAFIQSILQFDGRFGFLASKLGIDYLGLSWWAVCKK